MKRFIKVFFGVFILLSLLSGCASTRIVSNIKAQHFQTAEEVKFEIKKVSVDYSGSGGSAAGVQIRGQLTPELLMADANNNYKNYFSIDETAIPIEIRAKVEKSSTFALSLLIQTGTLTILGGILPLPESDLTKVNLDIGLQDEHSDLHLKGSAEFEQRKVRWMSIFTPLALIPIPGESDIPKISETIDSLGVRSEKASFKLLRKSVLDAVVQTLKGFDMQKIAASYKQRKHIISAKNRFLKGEPVLLLVDGREDTGQAYKAGMNGSSS